MVTGGKALAAHPRLGAAAPVTARSTATRRPQTDKLALLPSVKKSRSRWKGNHKKRIPLPRALLRRQTTIDSTRSAAPRPRACSIQPAPAQILPQCPGPLADCQAWASVDFSALCVGGGRGGGKARFLGVWFCGEGRPTNLLRSEISPSLCARATRFQSADEIRGRGAPDGRRGCPRAGHSGPQYLLFSDCSISPSLCPREQVSLLW